VVTDDLEARLKKDLEKSGFGSEMLASRRAVEAGFHIVGGDAFLDLDEERIRETDVSAWRGWTCRLDDESVALLSVFLSMEVKKSKQPWIVFSRADHPRFGGESGRHLIYASNLPADLFAIRSAVQTDSVRQRAGWVGTGVHEAFKKPSESSRWYRSCITACKAAESAMRREASAEDPRGSTADDLRQSATFFLISRPVVVLDGRLFRAGLGANAEIELNECQEAAFEFRFQSAHCQEGHYDVDLVTLRGLPNYLQRWTPRFEAIGRRLLDIAGLEDGIVSTKWS